MRRNRAHRRHLPQHEAGFSSGLATAPPSQEARPAQGFSGACTSGTIASAPPQCTYLHSGCMISPVTVPRAHLRPGTEGKRSATRGLSQAPCELA